MRKSETRLKWLSLCALVCSTSMASAATVLLNDDFSDTDRTNQALPSSAAFNFGSLGVTSAANTTSGGTASAASGALVLDDGPSGSNTVSTTAYFTDTGTQALANTGDSITLGFDFAYSLQPGGATPGNQTNAIRLGLYNSGSSRVTADIDTNNGTDAGYNGWTGYSLWSGLGTAASNALTVRKRITIGSGTSTPIDSPSNGTIVGAAGAQPATTANTVITGNFLTITKTATGVEVTGNVAGGTVDVVDTSPITTSFDALHFWFNGNVLATSGSLDNVSVTYAAATPEPASLGLLAAGAMMMLRRRRAV